MVLLLKFEAMALSSSEATSYSRATLSNCSNVSNVSTRHQIGALRSKVAGGLELLLSLNTRLDASV